MECFYELGIEPTSVAKFSGIGCSSKSPAYFLGLSHGFNSVHGRMPSIATGAHARQSHDARSWRYRRRRHRLDRSRPVHAHVRRNLPLIYVIENNGVYGLTKGQFSATADIGSTAKGGAPNDLPRSIVARLP